MATLTRSLFFSTALPALLCVQLAGVSHADTVTGKVVVDGEEVCLVVKGEEERSILVLGNAKDASTLAGRLGFLHGKRATLEGTVTPTRLGHSMLASRIVSPQFARITASPAYDPDTYGEDIRWRGRVYPVVGGSIGFEAPKNTHLEVFIFPNARKPERIQILRAQIRHEGKLAYVRRVRSERHVGGIPLPPGNPTCLWDFETHHTVIEDKEGKRLDAKWWLLDSSGLDWVTGGRAAGTDRARDGLAGRLGS